MNFPDVRPEDNALPATRRTTPDRPVSPLAPSGAIAPVQPGHGELPAAAPVMERRRSGERRRRNQPVLLDTRSGHDRRNLARQHADADPAAPAGIDVYA